MADKITITIADSGTIDGTYPIEMPLTNRDLHTIKDIAGVRAREIEQALEAGDNDIVVAFAYIGLMRNNRPTPVDVLWDLPVGRIQVELPTVEDEADADPPPVSDEQPDAVVRPISSGADSKQPSENPDSGQNSTGTPASAIGQGYA